APGPLRDLLGVRVDEVHPLPPGHVVELDDGSLVSDWMEDLTVSAASVVRLYRTGTYVSRPALTRRAHRGGMAWYLGARLDESARTRLLVDLCSQAEIRFALHEPGLEVVRRRATSGATFTIAINHEQQDLPLQVFGHELLDDRPWNPGDPVSAGGVVVVREERTGEACPGKK
ncbi:MAG: beta-galactosidase trimerization domain-containing protein, partial [Nocardioides sp.]